MAIGLNSPRMPVGRVGLHVERVDVRRAAELVEEDDVLGPRRADAGPLSAARSRSAGSGPAMPAAVPPAAGSPRQDGWVGSISRGMPAVHRLVTTVIVQCRSRNSLLLMIAQATSCQALAGPVA